MARKSTIESISDAFDALRAGPDDTAAGDILAELFARLDDYQQQLCMRLMVHTRRIQGHEPTFAEARRRRREVEPEAPEPEAAELDLTPTGGDTCKP